MARKKAPTKRGRPRLDVGTAFGRNLRFIRDSNEWSPKQAATFVGISEATWNKWEGLGKGRPGPPVSVFLRVSALLNIDPRELWEGDISANQ